jgi:hypothetical protein
LVLVTVERMASYERGDRGFAAGYGANSVAGGPFLVQGKRRAASHPQLLSFSPFPFSQTCPASSVEPQPPPAIFL